MRKRIGLIIVVSVLFLLVLTGCNSKKEDLNRDLEVQSAKSEVVKGEYAGLCGTWLYSDYTKYVFREDYTGCMTVDDVDYSFVYTVDEDTLYMDYENERVHDGQYTFSVNENKLRLIGGEGTDGKEYELERELDE